MVNHIRTCPNTRISLLCVTAALAAVAGTWTSTSASHASAVTASSQVIHETGNLHKISHNGTSFTERGSASGTFNGTMTLYLDITGSGVTFTMNGSMREGTLSARGSADIKTNKKIATIVGTAAFTGGSGRFAHARGSGLAVGGTFNRETYALSITVGGRLSY